MAPPWRPWSRRWRTASGAIDIYCSNAGIATGRGLADDAAWEANWRVHAMGHVHAARAVVPGMVERGRGAFVVTASAAGLLMMMQSAPYTVTKHASVAIAEWLAVNYGGERRAVSLSVPPGCPYAHGGEQRPGRGGAGGQRADSRAARGGRRRHRACPNRHVPGSAPPGGARIREGQGRRPGPMDLRDAPAAARVSGPGRR